ncbi:MAG: glycosyltransferase family 4 protein [Thermoanaerobacteraceae bacterium]|nr:glycosyltransferase family 4 protein [Thermoanaerobacteraceae bacterium]
MEIVYISRSILPSRAANSVHVMKMCQALAQNSHIVTLVAAKITKNQTEDLFNYYGVQENFKIMLLNGRTDKAAGLLLYLINFYLYIKKAKPPELFYSRDLFTLTLATLLINTPFLYETHKPPTTFIHSYLTRRLLKNKNLKKIVVITGALKGEYLKKFPSLPAEKITVAPDGADIPDTQMYKKAFKAKKDKLIIGYVGNLYPGRGMEIIYAVAKEIPQYDFNIIGGSMKDIVYWQNACQELKNIFFKGFVPHGELYIYYAEIDIVLAPYQKIGICFCLEQL